MWKERYFLRVVPQFFVNWTQRDDKLMHQAGFLYVYAVYICEKRPTLTTTIKKINILNLENTEFLLSHCLTIVNTSLVYTGVSIWNIINAESRDYGIICDGVVCVVSRYDRDKLFIHAQVLVVLTAVAPSSNCQKVTIILLLYNLILSSKMSSSLASVSVCVLLVTYICATPISNKPRYTGKHLYCRFTFIQIFVLFKGK